MQVSWNYPNEFYLFIFSVYKSISPKNFDLKIYYFRLLEKDRKCSEKKNQIHRNRE